MSCARTESSTCVATVKRAGLAKDQLSSLKIIDINYYIATTVTTQHHLQIQHVIFEIMGQ